MRNRCSRDNTDCHKLQKKKTKQVTAMKEAGQIEESNSSRCSPILIVPKKSEDPNKPKFRFCIDFRNVNKVTIKDPYPLPRNDDILDA